MHTAIVDREGMTEDMERHTRCTVMTIAHQSNGRVHQRVTRPRVSGRRTVMTTCQMDTRILSEVSRSKRMEMHTQCIKMKSQRQIGSNLRETMNQRSLNGQSMMSHLIRPRIRWIRGNGRGQANTHGIGRKMAMIMDAHIH